MHTFNYSYGSHR